MQGGGYPQPLQPVHFPPNPAFGQNDNGPRTAILTRIGSAGGCVAINEFLPTTPEPQYPEKYIRGLSGANQHVVMPYLPSSEKGHFAISIFIFIVWVLLWILELTGVFSLDNWIVILILIGFSTASYIIFEVSLQSKFKRFYMELESWCALNNQNLDGIHWEAVWREDQCTGSFFGIGLGRGYVRTGCGRAQVELRFYSPGQIPPSQMNYAGPGMPVQNSMMGQAQPGYPMQMQQGAPPPLSHTPNGPAYPPAYTN